MTAPQDPATASQVASRPPRLAAIDLGSNSFHLLVADYQNDRLEIVARHGEKVQLAAGLDEGGILDEASMARGLECLSRFTPLLQGVSPGCLRIVGTNALREAINREAFIECIRAGLGHRIEVITGDEEARLIYLGAAHALADQALADQALDKDHRRLVMDIGGGSTEFIIGEGFEPLALKSQHLGCVTFTRRFFADATITDKHMRQAELAALSTLAGLRSAYLKLGWQEAIGTSGTIKAAAAVLAAGGTPGPGEDVITREGMRELRRRLIELKHLDSVVLEGLNPDRARVFPAGMAILGAIFEAFELESLRYADGALREGVLHELMERHR
ncbi:MAG: Ppx/GppA family phosphatase [Halomonas sp.]|uniref:Ppx/GppA family phosphatase n=1 Tax=Halomonas sp. TaxID=1486246 RepID=UPI0017FA80B8|nr:Ppx/GppA family phosphatase [Halomonas sp.]